MRIESLSIRTATILTFAMIGIVAIVLSLLAGSYFRQSALDAQMHSLSRVIEVAAQQMLRDAQSHSFDLGMKLGNSAALARAMTDDASPERVARIVALLDDPFVNGFPSFADINLEKIRVYAPDLDLIAESGRGLAGLDRRLADPLVAAARLRDGAERFKALHMLWISAAGPLHSTLVPIGGMRLLGYLEVITNPVFNLPDIGNITRTPISIFSMDGTPIIDNGQERMAGHLPIEYIMLASDGQPAFRIVGYEDVARLNAEMEKTQWVTISGFLLLSIGTLMFALWLFSRFLFVPFRQMVADMKRMAAGEPTTTVNMRGLRDFTVLAETFDAMARQVRLRTGDLERLLDMDDSAILCFGADRELVYSNLAASRLLGYSREEITDLELRELFTEDVAALMNGVGGSEGPQRDKLHSRLHCIGKHGAPLPVDASVSSLSVQGGSGFAIVLTPAREDAAAPTAADAPAAQEYRQRIEAVEQSINGLLEIASTRPGLMSAATRLERLGGGGAENAKAALCAQSVGVMHAALACWEHDLGKSKLELAEASRIWPVYIDKSTPTTRTLDKYLHIDTCPRNPRTQRVIDTAEFVLRRTRDHQTAARKRLQQALEDFRLTLSGIKSNPP